MKGIMGSAVIVLSTVSLAFAQYEVTNYQTANALMIKGTIVDNASVNNHLEDLSDFVQGYTKNDAVAAEAIASGYSIYAGGRLYRFDEASSFKIADFLKAAFNEPQVIVVVQEGKEGFSLVSIKNQGEY